MRKITEGWHFRREATFTEYGETMLSALCLGFPTHGWVGLDRDGNPLAVSWVESSRGRVLSSFEITEE